MVAEPYANAIKSATLGQYLVATVDAAELESAVHCRMKPAGLELHKAKAIPVVMPFIIIGITVLLLLPLVLVVLLLLLLLSTLPPLCSYLYSFYRSSNLK